MQNRYVYDATARISMTCNVSYLQKNCPTDLRKHFHTSCIEVCRDIAARNRL